jgi:hypothetical protein
VQITVLVLKISFPVLAFGTQFLGCWLLVRHDEDASCSRVFEFLCVDFEFSDWLWISVGES